MSVLDVRAVSDTTRAFMEATVDLPALLQTVVERLAALIGDSCSLLLLSDDRTTLVPSSLADRDPTSLAAARAALMEPLTLARHPELAHALATGASMMREIPDLEQLRPPRSTQTYYDYVTLVGMHGVMMVALRVHGDSIGLLTFVRHRATPAPYTEDELAVANILADHAALAISNARLYDDEQAHQQFFKQSPLAKFIYDPATNRVLEVNDSALALYGYTREAFFAIDVNELRAPEPPAETAARLAAIGRSNVVGRRQVRRRDGTLVDVELWSTVARFHGRDARYVAVTDITDQISLRRARESEAEVRALLAEREQITTALTVANRELEAFSYSVAHDLRAPLRGMNGFAQILLEDYGDKLDAEGIDCIHTILSSSKKMGGLIDALLSLARTSRSVLNAGPGDLSSVARGVAAQLVQRDPDRTVEIVIEAGLRAEFDPQLAEALLENLMSNAWKFTAKVPHPRIEFFRAADSYCVRDNGAGFDMQYASKLFAPFQRMHSVAEYPGTGIGLATAQRIVHRHGGRIWAEAAPGKGAAFHFTLAGSTS